MIEAIIGKYQQRGLDALLKALPVNYCRLAAEALEKSQRGHVLLCTGFYSHGSGETDGPPGTYFLYMTLQKLGFIPLIVTDSYSEAYFTSKDLRCEIFDFQTEAKVLLEKYRPQAIIAIERCGRALDGKYYSMHKKDISPCTPPIDALFLQASCLRLGIGDGGNEIGMGKYSEILSHTASIIPSVVETDFLIPATVSNWGAYGLLAAMSNITKTNLLPSFEEVKDYLYFIVNKGATDGIKGAGNYSVDGFSLEIEKEILALLAAEAGY
ncbi:MAG: DUF4392 domain-containing protein [Bacteroidales bacterium]|jgi:hypothetical protein|nr:DUF4392 domain-containing protein [Bacteroidales bacterium]